MTAWQAWQQMAQESEQAARLAEAEGCLRSAASRYYYAAYQAATALLLYRGLTTPQGREAWSHEDTPVLISHETGTIVRSRSLRSDLARRLADLYRLRVRADYRPTVIVEDIHLRRAGREARFIIKTVDDVLPRGEQL